MVIETGRLRIVPLDADMLETLSRDVKEFEESTTRNTTAKA